MQRWHLFGLLLLAFYLSSCQDPTTLGTDLLDEDQAKVDYTDTFSVRAATVRGDSVVTYIPTRLNQLSSYLFGDFRDPVFGRSVSSVYTQLRLKSIKPDFTDAVLDSIVLVLPYDTTGLYGKIQGETFGIEVFRVIEPISTSKVYYSNDSFQVDVQPLGSMEFFPNLDSVPVIQYVSATTQDTISFPHLRIPLSQTLGEELLSLDTTVTRSSVDFIEYFNGIHFRPTLPTGGLLSFDLNNQPFRGGIYLYYRDDGGVKREFQFEINEFAARMVNYQHDYEGSPAGEVLGNFEAGDTALYLQGMAGLNAEIQLPDLSGLGERVIVNKAELIVELKMPQSGELFEPAGQLLLSTIENGRLRSISDVSIANNPQSVGMDRGFGGLLNEETGQYTMNISTHFQEVLEGIRPRTLYLSVFPKSETARRMILRGAEDGIKIRLSFTEL
jgi:hypothetical protein